jgi:hypothetical protein
MWHYIQPPYWPQSSWSGTANNARVSNRPFD